MLQSSIGGFFAKGCSEKLGVNIAVGDYDMEKVWYSNLKTSAKLRKFGGNQAQTCFMLSTL